MPTKFCTPRTRATLARARQLVAARPGITAKQLAYELGLSVNQAYAYLHEARKPAPAVYDVPRFLPRK